MATAFDKLIAIMDELREKCPWDRKQTIESLRQMTIEETYELGDAILEKNWQDIKEELGDLLLHIVFYAKIAHEENQFSIDDVIEGINQKLIKRHPHVYPPEEQIDGIKIVSNEDDVKKNWEKLKLHEGKTSVLSGVPKSLPAMVKAMRLQEKAKQVGFEWEKASDVWDKVQEEMDELQETISMQEKARQEEELGDVLFSIVNYARFLDIDAEAALEKTNKKFLYRFMKMEEIAKAGDRSLHELSLDDMNAIWNEIKSSAL